MANFRNRSRRDLFRQFGSAALALPFLQQYPRKAHAQAGSKLAKNLIVFYHPNGVYHQAYWPTGGERDFKFNTATAPLEKYRDKIIMLGPQFASATDRRPTGGTGLKHMARPPQHQAQIFLTGDPARAPYNNQTGDGLTVKTSHASLDQIVASKAKPTRFKSLEFGLRPVGGDTPSSINFGLDGSPLPRMTDPAAAWTRIFEGVTDSTGKPGEMAAMDPRRARVSSFLAQRFASLGGKLGATDRQALEHHMEAIREVEKQVLAPRPMAACAPSQVKLPAVPGGRAPTDIPAAAANFEDMIALAFACDLTRVASITFGYPGGGGAGGLHGTWLGFGDAHHSLSHHGNAAAKTGKLTQLMRWFAEQVTRTLDALAKYPHPDGEGTLLDNTILYWGSRHGEGNGHTNESIPNVLAGGAGGFWGSAAAGKGTGRFLNLPGTNYSALLLTLARAYGIELASFGGGAFRANEPIAALL